MTRTVTASAPTTSGANTSQQLPPAHIETVNEEEEAQTADDATGNAAGGAAGGPPDDGGDDPGSDDNGDNHGSDRGSQRSNIRAAAPQVDPAQMGHFLTQFFEGLGNLGNGGGSGGRANLRSPDVFDGRDPKKLAMFLSQCRINFQDRPNAFRNDRQKVNYAISYLKDTALTWFMPTVETDQVAPWQEHWPTFVKELQDNFGVSDPVGTAVRDLNQ